MKLKDLQKQLRKIKTKLTRSKIIDIKNSPDRGTVSVITKKHGRIFYNKQQGFFSAKKH